MNKELKKTPLHQWHSKQNANMAEFGQYEMPLWYPAGVRDEHCSVLLNAGLFDTSHMATIRVAGPDAFDLLQYCFSRDLRTQTGNQAKPLNVGKCVYGVFLNEKAEVIDDALVYAMLSDSFLIVVNSGMGEKILEHMHANKGGRSVRIADLTHHVGKIDLQGPNAAKILMKVLVDAEDVLRDMSYFSCKGTLAEGISTGIDVEFKNAGPILLSRTGYTGEFGFEIFTELSQTEKIWDLLIEAGREFRLLACGLAARDSLRTSAMLPLSHQDIGSWPFLNNPWTFVLPFNKAGKGFSKEFIGDRALLETDYGEYTYAFLGKDPRKVSSGGKARVKNQSGTEIGSVLTCVTDVGIGYFENRLYSISSPDKPLDFNPRGVCCGFIRVTERLEAGEMVELIDNRREIKVSIVDDIRPDRTARSSMTGYDLITGEKIMKDTHELILPENLRYAQDHEWARLVADTVRIGLSDYAQDQLGDIVFVELPAVGGTFEQGVEFGVIESVKTVAELYTPVGGEVVTVNRALEEKPELVNQSPYEEGWLIEIRPSNPGEFDQLMDTPAYLDMLKGLDE